ncbi:MAG: F0F1 ATP synthase subunit A [Alphaproteobacteria bacterium]
MVASNDSQSFPDPLHQFDIVDIGPQIHIGGIDLSFNNSALWMLIAAGLAFSLVFFGSAKKSLVPGRLQAFVEMLYGLVTGLIKDNIGSKGRAFFPFVFTLFIFIFFANALGLIPWSFTPTSHIGLTLFMAAFVMTMVTITGFVRHGIGFLRLFVPHGVPPLLLVLLVPIELFSYLARVMSLSVRLFANMFAGHMVMKVFASFILVFGLVGSLGMLVNVALYPFELFVAFIQAYIFSILTCLYLNDAVNMH